MNKTTRQNVLKVTAIWLFLCLMVGVTWLGSQINEAKAHAYEAPASVYLEVADDFDLGPHILNGGLVGLSIISVPEPEPEEYYEEVYYYEPVYYSNRYNNDFMSQGVIEENGVTYTWYSQNVLPGGGLTELNNNGRHVGEGGYIYDGDGYIAVASSDYEIGTVVETPFGEAKVYDTGCASGVIDVYTDF